MKMFITELCPTLCSPMVYSPPGPSVHGIFQEILWSGSPFPIPGDLPDPGIEPRSPALQADSLLSEPPGIFFLELEIIKIIFNRTLF